MNNGQQMESKKDQTEKILRLLTKRGFIGDEDINDEKIRSAQRERQKVAYHNTELLLKQYKNIAWMIECFPDTIAEELEQPFEKVDDVINRLDIEMSLGNRKKLFSYGNVGGIVGYAESSFLYKNDSACEISFYIKDSINNSAGGIVGYSIYTDIYECWNCSSVKYASASSESRTLAPRMGNIAGTFKYGKLKDNRYTANVYYGELKVVTWKGGFLNLTTYTWDQRQYVNQFGDAGELVSF